MIRSNNGAIRQAEFIPMYELLHKQSKGKIQLTREEKQRIQKFEKATRSERKHK